MPGSTNESTQTAATKDLDSSLVTLGQPTDGGCCWTNFGANPQMPKSATTKMTGWESLGELSANGFTETKSSENTTFKGWHGTPLLSKITSTEYSFKVEFVEINRASVAKLRYGKDAVETGDDGSVSHIKALADKGATFPLVFDELESNGFLRRTVIPKASITSFDDVPHQQGSLMVYGMTLTALQDGENPAYDIYRAKPSAV